MVFFYRTSHTPTTVNNHITTKHKASLILSSDIKAASLLCWEHPKAAIAVFGEGSVEKGRTRLHLHQHLLLQKSHPQSFRSTIIKEFHVGRSKEKRTAWDPSPCTWGCSHSSEQHSSSCQLPSQLCCSMEGSASASGIAAVCLCLCSLGKSG